MAGETPAPRATPGAAAASIALDGVFDAALAVGRAARSLPSASHSVTLCWAETTVLWLLRPSVRLISERAARVHLRARNMTSIRGIVTLADLLPDCSSSAARRTRRTRLRRCRASGRAAGWRESGRRALPGQSPGRSARWCASLAARSRLSAPARCRASPSSCPASQVSTSSATGMRLLRVRAAAGFPAASRNRPAPACRRGRRRAASISSGPRASQLGGRAIGGEDELPAARGAACRSCAPARRASIACRRRTARRRSAAVRHRGILRRKLGVPDCRRASRN